MSNTILIYFLLSFIVLFICGKISYILNLVDIPNKRKIHSKATAYTGGIAISIILLCAIILFDDFNKSLSSILSLAFLISIVGLVDDKYHLNIGGKLSLQIIPIFYLVIFQNLALNQIGDYNYFKLELGTFAIPFTFLSVLFLINAFNYFDGIDGMLGFTSISVFAILYFLVIENNTHHLVNEQNIQFFLIALIIPIIVFLLFNFSFLKVPKIFLGDGGSLLLGFIVSFILIYFANQNLIHPILLAWSIVIFVYEFLSINIIRLKNKQMLFKAGQDHLHHILLKDTKSIFLTNFLISSLNIILFAIGYLSYLFINELISFILFITFFIIFLIFRNIYSRKI
jgi:UDP-GlcNAc:undecaprenyl-phosphate/decaprenyl-phosphate GlcNAc-1-phosphate transferase